MSPPRRASSERRPTHRGVALLLTLVTLVIVATALGTLMRLATMDALATETRSRRAHAGSVLRGAEAPIIDWLVHESHRTVLPPEAATPAVAILNDAWIAGSEHVRLRITAFDQRGLPSRPMLIAGSPMRQAIPADVVASLDAVDVEAWRQGPGLDLLCGRASPYPVHPPETSSTFGDAKPEAVTKPPERTSFRPIGACIATHNPAPSEGASRRRRRSPAAINVSTAPIEVVEHALRMAGRGGLEMIIDARARGEKPAISGEPIGEPHPGSPVIVAVSDVWAFRVDASVGGVTRARWLVYARRDAGWKLLQLLEIEQ
jgi:hypothetical protein